MRYLKLLFTFLSIALISTSYSQGTNNDFRYDDEDLKFLFEKMGFGTFKFPVKQSKNQIFDIVIEEYREGVLTNRQTAIEITNEAFKDYGLDAKKYAKPIMDSTQVDSTYFHRFYIERSDSLLTLHVKTHGISTPVKFDIKDLFASSFRARYETKEEIDSVGYLNLNGEDKILLLFYANNDPDMPLWCPAGLPIERIKERFYYTVFVYITEL